MNTDQKIEMYCKRGWCPVPWAHHPKEIRDELRRMRFRPKMKSCFENCQRFVMHTMLDVRYTEGYAVSMIPVEHAWLTWNGRIIDLTLQDVHSYLSGTQYTWGQVAKSISKTGVFGPVNQSILNQTLLARFLQPSGMEVRL
jgi:hypothetical protein